MTELKCNRCLKPSFSRSHPICQECKCNTSCCMFFKIPGYSYCNLCICDRNGCPKLKSAHINYRDDNGHMIMYGNLTGPELRAKAPHVLYCGYDICLTMGITNEIPTKY